MSSCATPRVSRVPAPKLQKWLNLDERHASRSWGAAEPDPDPRALAGQDPAPVRGGLGTIRQTRCCKQVRTPPTAPRACKRRERHTESSRRTGRCPKTRCPRKQRAAPDGGASAWGACRIVARSTGPAHAFVHPVSQALAHTPGPSFPGRLAAGTSPLSSGPQQTDAPLGRPRTRVRAAAERQRLAPDRRSRPAHRGAQKQGTKPILSRWKTLK